MFDDINSLLLSALAALLCLTVHEFCHGLVADKLGDPTARSLGRLSLNPIKHLDLFGTLSMILFRFGWAKPVPVNTRYFKKPKRDFALVALAGPLSNILMGFFTVPILLGLQNLFAPIIFSSSSEVIGSVWYNFCINTIIFLTVFHVMNIGLGIFNLIPVPPFDGSRLINVILPERIYFKVMEYERYIYWGVIGWLFIGDYVTSALLSVPFIATNPVLSTIACVFSLSDMLQLAAGYLSSFMIWLWRLIPIFN